VTRRSLGPLSYFGYRPLRCLLRVTAVATVGNTELDGVGGGDEIERVVTRFAGNGILTRLGHVAFDTAAANARGSVVRVVREGFVLKSSRLSRFVARQA
jgi:hypothetical protein